MISEKKFNLWICVLMVGAVVFVLGVVMRHDREKAERGKREIAQMKEEFQQETLMAMRATSDSCAEVFFEFVVPPKGLDEKPRLVMMGEEVSYSLLDSSMYFLSQNGERVELWKRGVLLGQTRFSRKIGEKYDPDSHFCQEKAKLELE